MAYVELINDSLDYIEEHLHEKINIKTIASELHISEYHFNRIFTFMTGISPKKYLMKRKLSETLEQLKNSDESIINIALNFGFDYPEVFSRAFKRQFGLSPKAYRNRDVIVDPMNKADIIKNDCVNFNGGVTLKVNYMYLEDLRFIGECTYVSDMETTGFGALEAFYTDFLYKSGDEDLFNRSEHYHVVTCQGDERTFEVFYGYKPLDGLADDILLEQGYMDKNIPGSWYAAFTYTGDMKEIYPTFVSDLNQWIRVKRVPIKVVGAGMIVVYKADYDTTKTFDVLIQVERILDKG